MMVPQHLVTEVINKHHDSTFAGHGGVSKTKVSLAKAHLFWTNMNHDINTYIKECQTCQSLKGNVSHQHNLSTTHDEAPFKRIVIDYFGPLPTSTSGHQYILVIIDTFTKYVELYPTKSTASQELANIVYNQFIMRHGVTLEIMCDNGNSLGSQFPQQLARFVDIHILYTLPYHPASNGIVERFMKALRTMIMTYTNIKEVKTQWRSSNLRLIRFIYNNMYHHAIKTSPFELVHGRTARTPITTIKEDKLPDMFNNQETPESYFAKELNKRLEITFQHVHQHLDTLYNNSKAVKVFKVDDKVYVFNNRVSTVQETTPESYKQTG